VNRDHLQQALTLLGVAPMRYYVEGIAPEQMHSEGWYAVEARPGVWDGGYYERNLRDPFVSGTTEDMVVRWMLARLTDSAGDRTTGELVWGPPTLAWVVRRIAATTAGLREAADVSTAGLVSLSPGYVCDEADAGTMLAVIPGGLQARRPVLVSEPFQVRATVQMSAPGADSAVVAFRPEGAGQTSVEELVQSGTLARVTLRPDTEESP
jgi:hypothetical protein